MADKEKKDTSNLFDGFFEGPEKLLEVWFVKPADIKLNDVVIKKGGLRSVPQKDLEDMLALVQCTIISKTSNDYFDAYVLSESSLFVWEQKIILKTCGTTLLLNALDPILKFGRDCGLTVIGDVFYSRRNFFAQPKQKGLHSSWDLEVAKLNETLEGSAYILGKTNGEHWFLYLTDQGHLSDNSGTQRGPLPILQVPKVTSSEPDFTLEILMTKLDRKIMEQFYKKEQTPKMVTKSSGIGDLFPDAVTDECLFDPCGYSMNGLLGDGYFTIHVTPQPSCSYVSFETNIQVPNNDYSALVEKVLKVFKPGKFSLSLFGGFVNNFPSIAEKTFQSHLLGSRKCSFGTHCPMYLRSILATCAFDNDYELVYAQYEYEMGFEGGSKRKTMC